MKVDSRNSAGQGIQNTGNAGRRQQLLGKDEFLQLLVTQLRYQDPMEPMKDNEFIAQLAQFSTLEQMKNVAQGIEQLNENFSGYDDRFSQFSSSFTQYLNEQRSDYSSKFFGALSLLGKEVSGTGGSGELITGVVTSVKMSDGEPTIFVGDVALSWRDIVEVNLPLEPEPTSAAGDTGGDSNDGQDQPVPTADTAGSAGETGTTG